MPLNVKIESRSEDDICPDCGNKLVHRNGCVECPVCGFSFCN